MTGAKSATVTLAQAIQIALAHHQAGRLPQAEALYRQILQAEPNQPDALHFLGVLAKQVGKYEIAVELIGRALAVKPDYAEAHSNLGNALQAQGKLDEAVASYHKALSIRPNYAEAYYNLGNALHAQDNLGEAVASYRKALELEPDSAKAYSNLGNVLKDQGLLNEAVESLHKALALNPDFAEAHNNLGNVLLAQGRLDGALESLHKALALKPDYAEARNNMGTLFLQQGQMDEALESFHNALAIKPDYAEAHSNMGNVYKEKGDFSLAEASYRRAIELDPAQESFRLNHGILLLSTGDFGGLDDYEHRWKGKAAWKLRYSHPWWDGSDLSGKTILVWGEQGINDELLYASMIPDMTKLAGGCVFECERRLVSLFARSFPDVEVIPRSTPPHPRTTNGDITLQSPAGSLMRWLRPGLESFPQHCGYLKADEERVAHWKKRLDALGAGIKVGICWTSANVTAGIHKACTRLEQWAPIFGVKGIDLVNLQYTDCREELEGAEQRFGVKIQRWDDLDLKNDLDEVAALTAALDLVISVDTAVPTMVGALGKPVWVMVPKNVNWMHLGTDYMPWFPSMKLFCREWNETWDGVIGAVSHELALLA